MKVLTTNKFELKEYADEENNPLVKLNLSKWNTSWCLLLGINDLSILAIACN